jgi:hypothetical protein
MQDSNIRWFEDRKRAGKSLVYFASGTIINKDFLDLNYDNIFLIDYDFRGNSYYGDKIFCLKLDCIEAISLLKKLRITINCFVGLNEGLSEGGGHYPINSDCFLGYSFPLFSDTLIHIGCKDYYYGKEFSHLWRHFLDLPYLEKHNLKLGDPEYISPLMFSQWGERASVTLLKKKSTKEHKFTFNGQVVTLRHKSIWEDIEQLDAIYVRYDNSYQKERIEAIEKKAYPVKYNGLYTPNYKTYSFAEVIDMCNSLKFNKIGIVPTGGNNLKMIEEIKLKKSDYPNEIILYHLNKDDFSMLYKIT